MDEILPAVVIIAMILYFVKSVAGRIEDENKPRPKKSTYAPPEHQFHCSYCREKTEHRSLGNNEYECKKCNRNRLKKS